MDAVRCSSPMPVEGKPLALPTVIFCLIGLDRCMAIGNISESTFYRLIQRGAMPAATKIGRANRWVESEVIAAYQRLAQGGGE